jgi:hypothetical protein
LKRSSTKFVEKEADATRLKQQLDETVAKDGNEVRKLTQDEKDEILDELEGQIEKEKIKKKIDEKYKEFCEK